MRIPSMNSKIKKNSIKYD